MALRVRAALALAVCVLACSPAAALGDADPASDTLLTTDVFYPYEPPTPVPLQQALQHALDEVHADGLQLKVAIIGSPSDLGGIPAVFGHPERYASFLDYEITPPGSEHPQPLLVVMPDGVASSHAGPQQALRGLSVTAGGRAGGLARTALAAVERIARARGRPIEAPAARVSDGAAGSAPAIPVALLAVAALAVGVLITVRAGRRRPGGAGSG